MILTTFSECGTYRYTLLRAFDGNLFSSRKARIVNFVMLNPSTADEYKNDPTVAKCVRYAKRWGYDGLYVTNLFAYRSTDPKALKQVADPVGPENDRYIEEVANASHLVIAAWGAHGRLLDRAESVKQLLAGYDPHCLRLGAKEPWHPLYLPDALEPMAFA